MELVSCTLELVTHGTPATKVDTVGKQLALADSTQDQQSQPPNNSENFAPPPRSKTCGVNTSRPSYSFSKASSLREVLAVTISRLSSRSASPKKKAINIKPTMSMFLMPKTITQEVALESHKKAHIEALARSTTFQSKSSLTPCSVEYFNNAPTPPYMPSPLPPLCKPPLQPGTFIVMANSRPTSLHWFIAYPQTTLTAVKLTNHRPNMRSSQPCQW